MRKLRERHERGSLIWMDHSSCNGWYLRGHSLTQEEQERGLQGIQNYLGGTLPRDPAALVVQSEIWGRWLPTPGGEFDMTLTELELPARGAFPVTIVDLGSPEARS
jgi:hypothetical protein